MRCTTDRVKPWQPEKAQDDHYYYAGGNRVALKPALDLIAVDDARLAEKLPALQASDAALREGTPLRGGIRLVRVENLAPGTLVRLQKATVTQPVFRQDGTILIALPEIRIEDDNQAKLAEVREFAAAKARPVADEIEGRLTLRPQSDDGRDALTLANELVERYKPASVSPRFLRSRPWPSYASLNRADLSSGRCCQLVRRMIDDCLDVAPRREAAHKFCAGILVNEHARSHAPGRSAP